MILETQTGKDIRFLELTMFRIASGAIVYSTTDGKSGGISIVEQGLTDRIRLLLNSGEIVHSVRG